MGEIIIFIIGKVPGNLAGNLDISDPVPGWGGGVVRWAGWLPEPACPSDRPPPWLPAYPPTPGRPITLWRAMMHALMEDAFFL